MDKMWYDEATQGAVMYSHIPNDFFTSMHDIRSDIRTLLI